MKILVTGSAGMIGTKLVEMLINNNIPVVGCDNFFRGEKGNIDYLSELATSKNSSFEFYELDLLDGLPASILEDIDTVVHLADVVGGIKYVFKNQFEVFNLNEELVCTFFGKRKPGIPEDKNWTKIVNELA